jgi:hypothetical protein
MKTYILIFLITLGSISSKAQSCEKTMEYVKSKDNGTTYRSYDSKAISKVTFYTIYVEYKNLYFAIVCFKKKYSYSCNEYIYQVSSSTKFNYSLNYLDSAGKAFNKYIDPHRKNLNCSPNFN